MTTAVGLLAVTHRAVTVDSTAATLPTGWGPLGGANWVGVGCVESTARGVAG